LVVFGNGLLGEFHYSGGSVVLLNGHCTLLFYSLLLGYFTILWLTIGRVVFMLDLSNLGTLHEFGHIGFEFFLNFVVIGMGVSW
jgi:hypothetical protein